MTTRILLAGILAAVGMFVWVSIAHMALPLGEAGIREIPNEAAVTAAMRTNMGDQPALTSSPAWASARIPPAKRRKLPSRRWPPKSRKTHPVS